MPNQTGPMLQYGAARTLLHRTSADNNGHHNDGAQDAEGDLRNSRGCNTRVQGADDAFQNGLREGWWRAACHLKVVDEGNRVKDGEAGLRADFVGVVGQLGALEQKACELRVPRLQVPAHRGNRRLHLLGRDLLAKGHRLEARHVLQADEDPVVQVHVDARLRQEPLLVKRARVRRQQREDRIVAVHGSHRRGLDDGRQDHRQFRQCSDIWLIGHHEAAIARDGHDALRLQSRDCLLEAGHDVVVENSSLSHLKGKPLDLRKDHLVAITGLASNVAGNRRVVVVYP
mmetsp:Transcript_30763/g.85821  ORF Transcript_30763/g.85821 Transcript_30763/m.85821 type:complete len:286 (-) Transcript_30763:39-896(-)